MKTPPKLALLTTLYLSQGLPFGFFTQALPVLLRQQEASLTAIGFSSLLATPWMLKFLWAPAVDRYHWPRLGRRKSWILPAQILAVLLLCGISFLRPEIHLPWILGAVLLANLLAATQDVATDGLAVSLLTHRERGLGNGVQVAGYRLGMVIGGGALLVAFGRLGWSATFGIMAGILAIATLPIALHHEEESAVDPDELPDIGEIVSGILKRPGMGRWLALLVAFKVGEALGGGVVRPMLVDLGLDMEDIGWMLGFAGFLSSLVGALAGGAMTTWLGRRRALVAFGLLQATGVAAYLAPVFGYTSIETLYVVTVYDHLVGSMATAALFTAMMDACDPDQGGTDYTVQASVVVMATGLGATLSGLSADTFGYFWHFVIATALTVAGAAVVWWGFSSSPGASPEPATSR